MASLLADAKEGLPSIDNFDFEKFRFESKQDHRVSMPGLNSISGNVPRSPTSTYSVPPPPYSSGGSKTQSLAGYMSPVQSTSRRSTRDEKDSPQGITSLPSISEALKSTDITSAPQPYSQPPIPTGSAFKTMSDGARGPGNPFSQPVASISTLRPHSFSGPDANSISTLPPPPLPPDSRNHPAAVSSSPRLSTSSHRSSTSHRSGAGAPDPLYPSFTPESTHRGYPFTDFAHKANLANTSPTKQKPKEDLLFSKPGPPRPYSDTIKRHLEIYDAELALKELMDSSARTLQFASEWTQRYHQSNRTTYINDGLPSTPDVDDMLQITHKMIDNLTKLRDVSVAQETAINEQRARLNQGPSQESDPAAGDAFGSGGFAGGDAKKRRGKAAPPGRCHSCNRAETPEWRRGPDGARTLCNACGLHYAKLTRKVGAKNAAVMTGSNLRPKSLAETRP